MSLESEEQGAEQVNPEYEHALEVLHQEFERRSGNGELFMEQMRASGAQLDWFIVPPVLTRTDFGYASDLDVVAVYDGEDSPQDYQTDINDTFILPTFVSRNELEEMGKMFPELQEWYERKLHEPKPSQTANTDVIPLDDLEDTLRYGVSPEVRRGLIGQRKLLAEKFMQDAKRRVDVTAWGVAGSTVNHPEKVSICSDLDLDILVDPKTPEEQVAIYFYLTRYLKYKYAENAQVKIDVSQRTIAEVKRYIRLNEKMRAHFEAQFGMKFPEEDQAPSSQADV